MLHPFRISTTLQHRPTSMREIVGADCPAAFAKGCHTTVSHSLYSRPSIQRRLVSKCCVSCAPSSRQEKRGNTVQFSMVNIAGNRIAKVTRPMLQYVHGQQYMRLEDKFDPEITLILLLPSYQPNENGRKKYIRIIYIMRGYISTDVL